MYELTLFQRRNLYSPSQRVRVLLRSRLHKQTMRSRYTVQLTNLRDSSGQTELSEGTHRLLADVKECASNPCQHGSTCQDVENAFTCKCLPGYQGDFCQIGAQNNKITTMWRRSTTPLWSEFGFFLRRFSGCEGFCRDG